MHCQQMHYSNSRDELSDRRHVLKDFDSKTEVMGLKYPCGNADGINDLVSQGQTIIHIGALSLAL